jgi:hypothetical protein
MLSAARKQWLKITRAMQKQRSSTLNADKILKYTHLITSMQRLRFSAKSPIQSPDADVYFLSPSEVAVMPIQCWTVYVLDELDDASAQAMLRLLPVESLVVDYGHAALWERVGLLPKKLLEERLTQEWQHAESFLERYDIHISEIVSQDMRTVEAMDDALDTLLTVSHKFLQVALQFQRALEIARPMRLSREARAKYDIFALLAHRVQALSPGAFTQQFLEVYNEDDTFFLYDRARELARRGRTSAALQSLFPFLPSLPPISKCLSGPCVAIGATLA